MWGRKPPVPAPEAAVPALQPAAQPAQLGGGERRLERLDPRDHQVSFSLIKPLQVRGIYIAREFLLRI